LDHIGKLVSGGFEENFYLLYTFHTVKKNLQYGLFYKAEKFYCCISSTDLTSQEELQKI